MLKKNKPNTGNYCGFCDKLEHNANKCLHNSDTQNNTASPNVVCSLYGVLNRPALGCVIRMAKLLFS